MKIVKRSFRKLGVRRKPLSMEAAQDSMPVSHIVCQHRELSRWSAAMQGRRALDFVLKNQGLIDKTLLFDIELIKVD